jgi:DNA adenine methylase
MAEPIFKWTGGKRRLLSKYEDLGFFPDPSQFDTFVDLFFGGGAITCTIADHYPNKKLIINDIKGELTTLYNQMRDNWDEFVYYYQKSVEIFLNTEGKENRSSLYYSYRQTYCHDYQQMCDAEISAYLLVMMKTNFNGLWKNYKMMGKRYATCPGTCKWTEKQFDLQKVESFRDMLQRSTIYNRSFEEVPIPDNSWVYADPPYRDTSDVYAGEFGDDKQVELCSLLSDADKRGCLIGLSNKEIGDGFWDNNMKDYKIHYLDHKYTCGYGDSGYPITEVLIKNYGKPKEVATLDQFF